MSRCVVDQVVGGHEVLLELTDSIVVCVMVGCKLSCLCSTDAAYDAAGASYSYPLHPLHHVITLDGIGQQVNAQFCTSFLRAEFGYPNERLRC